MGRFIDMIGKRFGRLTVRRFSYRKCPGRLMWECICDCGNYCMIEGNSLRSRHTISCGCWHREVIEKQKLIHGHARKNAATPEYKIWCGISARCYNPKKRIYKYYGGRGIKMCTRWRRSFTAFLKDVKRKPSPGHTIDRIDNDGNYEPGNVRWATMSEQARNRRGNHLITINGQTKCLSEWAEIVGIKRETIKSRLNRHWPIERLLEPLQS